ATASFSFPVINMEKLETQERGAAMGVIGDACENWGFFELLNHGISHELLDEVERASKAHYAACREEQFKEFAAKTLEAGEKGADVKDVDWESTFFVRHLPARPRPPLQASDEGIRGGDREAGGEGAGPAVREPGSGAGLPEAGLRRFLGPDVRHQGQQLPAVPAAGHGGRPTRAHRRRRRHHAFPGRSGQRAPAAQGRSMGRRAAHAPRHSRQHRRPAGGDHQWAVQERDAPRAHPTRRQPHVHRLILQPRRRRRHLPGHGARRGAVGGGGACRERRVPEVRVRGLHEPVHAPQVRGQGAALRGHEGGRRAHRHRVTSTY
uniref:Non-haem dioxygenase N-terminal domain-containing protein n=1 Tax=Aegilops tauschii subsp. strangulata TaxID=200361 RepID=A0A453PPG3_AEGTS